MNNNLNVGVGQDIGIGSNNLMIGKNAGYGMLNKSNQVRIGNFEEGEELNGFIDCATFKDGDIVIKNNVMDFILKEQGLDMKTVTNMLHEERKNLRNKEDDTESKVN
jgi:hypothetical protein